MELHLTLESDEHLCQWNPSETIIVRNGLPALRNENLIKNKDYSTEYKIISVNL